MFFDENKIDPRLVKDVDYVMPENCFMSEQNEQNGQDVSFMLLQGPYL